MFESLSALFSANSWLYTVLALIAIISTLLIIIIILSENRNPVKSLAWVTVLLLLPVVGLILYLFFGRSIKNTRMISRRSRRKLRRHEGRTFSDPRSAGLTPESLQQINLGRSLTGAQYYGDNTVEVFTGGKDKFAALEQDLKAARHSINIQYYIFEDDNIGLRIADILAERAAAGVKVRLIYDHVGSFHVRSRFFKQLRERGIDAQPFFKVTFPQFGTHVNWRNHRKLCIIDRSVGYLGGMNVADRYIDGGKKFACWRDTHVRVEGPVVQALQYSFIVDWSFMGGGLIDENTIPPVSIPRTGLRAISGVGAQMLTSGPTSQWSNIALAIHKAIANARRRVYIQTPYFLPTEALLKALQSAALAHVDVRIMVPEHSDSMMLTHASNSYISECLRAGIKIYQYKAGMLHSKTMIVDDEFVTIGSTNFDFRSFDYNFEANLFFYSAELNRQMLEVFRNDLSRSDRVLSDQWHKRPLPKRIAESVLRLLSPVL
ncbi:MAG: cardiolipin synthase [Muribaculaceae bacterium]|nr:cardiolipin synthase [Muribaculaceae bacterium]